MNVGDWIRKRGQISCDETAVIFEDNRREGNRPVVLKHGETMTEEEATGFLKGKLAKYKIPKQVEFTDEFPKTASGKIKKADLKKRYARPRK